MKTTALGLFFVLVLATALDDVPRFTPMPAQNVEVSGIVVDGLGRPVPDVNIRLACCTGSYQQPKVAILGTFTTDTSGRYEGVVHVWPESGKIERSVAKAGYREFSSLLGPGRGVPLEFVQNCRQTLRRDMPWEEAVIGLLHLEGEKLDQHVLEVLASAWRIDGPFLGNHIAIEDTFFAYQHRLLPALHKAGANPHVGDKARVLLEFLGELRDPHELQLIKSTERSAPKIQVSRSRLNDAVQAVAQDYQLVGQEEELFIDKTVFRQDYEMALVRCQVHRGNSGNRGYKLRFERVESQWILKAFILDGFF